jgi:hypothetical protein
VRLKYLIEGEDSESEEIADATPAILPESSSSSVEVFDAAEKLYEETYNSFYLFFDKIFSIALKNKYGKYVSGDYIKRSCDFLQNNKRTMYISGRGHLKSIRLYALLAWKIWKNKKDKKNLRIDYLSYNQDLAAMHIDNLKDLINRTFFFYEGLYDEDSTASSKASYIWLEPGMRKEELPKIDIGAFGILGGLRGGHPDAVFLDDPYTNDMKKQVGAIEPDIVKKINTIFDTTVLPMPLFDGEIHITGTPQSYADLWFNPKYKKIKKDDYLKFVVKIEPVYKHYDYITQKFIEGAKEEALWPEMFPLEGLKQQEEILTLQQFKQEYLCVPRSSAESFFEQDRIEKSMEYGRQEGLINYDDGNLGFLRFNRDDFWGQKIVAGYDAGKSRHPAHFVVFAYGNGMLTQILSKWMDSWDYSFSYEGKPSQFKYINDAVKHFGIQKIWGDNTNSVLTSAIERGDIPGLVEIKISHSLKGKMAYSLQKHLGKPELRLLGDNRQSDSLLSVQNEGLKIVETTAGHGEAFTSLGFVLINTVDLGKGGASRRITIKTEKDKIPKMYKGFFFDRTSSFGSNRRDLSSMQNPRNLRNLGRMMM